MSSRKFLHTLTRAGIFTLGLFILSFGVAVSIRANLGVGPIVAVPTVLSYATSLSVGTLMIIFNLLLLGVSLLVMGRSFPPFQLVQIPVAFLNGLFIDICLALTPWVNPTNYAMQWVWVVISTFIIGLGVYVEMRPRFTYIPADGLVALLANKNAMKVGNLKMIFDWTLVLSAVIMSFILLGELDGIREGTIFVAFGVGAVIKLLGNLEASYRAAKNR